jgi:hypothetical protein
VLQDVLSIMKERGFLHISIIDQDSGPSGVLNVQDAFRSFGGGVPPMLLARADEVIE